MSSGPNGRRRIDDDRRQTLLGHELRHLGLGEGFRALVRTDAVFRRRRPGLVPEPIGGRRGQRRHAAGVDDAADARFQRGQHESACAVDVDAVHALRVRHPDPIVRRAVEQRVAAANRPGQRRVIEKVAGDGLDLQAPDVVRWALGANQRANVVGVGEEPSNDRRADETGCAGDERFHRLAQLWPKIGPRDPVQKFAHLLHPDRTHASTERHLRCWSSRAKCASSSRPASRYGSEAGERDRLSR